MTETQKDIIKDPVVLRPSSLDALREFTNHSALLGVVKRTTPKGANAFFQKIMKKPFEVAGRVEKKSAYSQIRDILKDSVTDGIQSDPFYENWLEDMSEVCKVFCDIQKSDAICFWLGSKRGCRRYHIDNVPRRMLVTYAGKGTEWLPDSAADRKAYIDGAPNEEILRDKSDRQFMDQWDVAIFRGGKEGLLHRTPDAALNRLSILMRLDQLSFWENTLKHYYKTN